MSNHPHTRSIGKSDTGVTVAPTTMDTLLETISRLKREVKALNTQVADQTLVMAQVQIELNDRNRARNNAHRQVLKLQEWIATFPIAHDKAAEWLDMHNYAFCDSPEWAQVALLKRVEAIQLPIIHLVPLIEAALAKKGYKSTYSTAWTQLSRVIHCRINRINCDLSPITFKEIIALHDKGYINPSFMHYTLVANSLRRCSIDSVLFAKWAFSQGAPLHLPPGDTLTLVHQFTQDSMGAVELAISFLKQQQIPYTHKPNISHRPVCWTQLILYIHWAIENKVDLQSSEVWTWYDSVSWVHWLNNQKLLPPVKDRVVDKSIHDQTIVSMLTTFYQFTTIG